MNFFYLLYKLNFIVSMTEQSCDGDTKIKPTDCVIQPCEVTHCPNFPNAICLPDYCQECKARFYNNFDVEVTDQCSKTLCFYLELITKKTSLN